jgi:hypothetical protein
MRIQQLVEELNPLSNRGGLIKVDGETIDKVGGSSSDTLAETVHDVEIGVSKVGIRGHLTGRVASHTKARVRNRERARREGDQVWTYVKK